MEEKSSKGRVSILKCKRSDRMNPTYLIRFKNMDLEANFCLFVV